MFDPVSAQRDTYHVTQSTSVHIDYKPTDLQEIEELIQELLWGYSHLPKDKQIQRDLSTAIKYNNPDTNLQLWKPLQLRVRYILDLHSMGTEQPLLATLRRQTGPESKLVGVMMNEDADQHCSPLITSCNEQLCAYFHAVPEAREEVNSHKAISLSCFKPHPCIPF